MVSRNQEKKEVKRVKVEFAGLIDLRLLPNSLVNTYTFFGSKLFILKDTFVTRKRKKTFITFEKHINSQLYCIFSFADKSSLTIILPCCLALCTMRMGSLFSELLFIGSGKLCSLRCDVSPPSRLRYHPATQKQPAS